MYEFVSEREEQRERERENLKRETELWRKCVCESEIRR